MAIDASRFERMTEDYTAAWNSGEPQRVVAHFADGRGITINRGANQFGQEAMLAMAGGFMSAFPDLRLTCDFHRLAGTHAIYGWRLEGHHADTGNKVTITGFEEWDLDDDCRIVNSLGWFDAADYDRQVAA